MSTLSDRRSGSSDHGCDNPPTFLKLLFRTASETLGGDDFLLAIWFIAVVAVILLVSFLSSHPAIAAAITAGVGFSLLLRAVRNSRSGPAG